MIKRIRTSRAFLSLALIVVLLLGACISEDDLTLEQRAYTLDRQLMCPVCDGQTIDQSHAQIAEDMKSLVRIKLAEGATNQEIKDYFVARYGEAVLGAPPAGGFNLIAWVMPGVITLGGIAIVVFAARNMRRQRVAAAPRSTEEELSRYLEQVDTELGLKNTSSEERDGKAGIGG